MRSLVSRASLNLRGSPQDHLHLQENTEWTRIGGSSKFCPNCRESCLFTRFLFAQIRSWPSVTWHWICASTRTTLWRL